MKKLATSLPFVLVLFGSQVCCATTNSPAWFDRAPLNTDAELVGITGEAWYGLGQAYRYLAFVLNFPVLAGLLYLLARAEVDFAYFIPTYFGILLGSFLLSVVLNPYLRVFSLAPIVVFVAVLLKRFCSVSWARAFLAASLYQIYQILYLMVYKIISAAYPSA